MINGAKSILVFGGSDYQLSLINECKAMGLYTVVIDPNSEAIGKHFADAFEIVDGQDFLSTCKVVEKYKIDGIVTAATDKPLVMMAKIAEKYKFNFISLETAILSTDKYLMKKVFNQNNIPCAKGELIEKVEDLSNFPIIIKPRDASGSRGVFYCLNKEDAKNFFTQVKKYTLKNSILAENYLKGKEYSIEAIHFDNISKVVQITEKFVTELPYNVEIGHIQPAGLDDEIVKKIENLTSFVAKSFNFLNCVSHNEIKINDKGEIFFIEVSPRLGGDFISSTLVEISTGLSMERVLIDISLNNPFKIKELKNNSCGVFYFNLKPGILKKHSNLKKTFSKPCVVDWKFNLNIGDKIPVITNSLDRYGYFIIKEKTREELLYVKNEILKELNFEIL
jgi:carbamoyl-phosphate synthase large subunit